LRREDPLGPTSRKTLNGFDLPIGGLLLGSGQVAFHRPVNITMGGEVAHLRGLFNARTHKTIRAFILFLRSFLGCDQMTL
jgi:hypothetical protein